jgi:hypothetical protein
MMIGNKHVKLTGERLWKNAKDIKRRFLNHYLPCMPKVIPSGTTSDDKLFYMCLKNCWIKDEREKLKNQDKDPNTLDLGEYRKKSLLISGPLKNCMDIQS